MSAGGVTTVLVIATGLLFPASNQGQIGEFNHLCLTVLDGSALLLYVIFRKLSTIKDDLMPPAAQPRLERNRVYRTADLAKWGRNPSRLARRLVRQCALERLGHGLFVSPRRTKFGWARPTDEELLRGFLGNTPFVMTGPERWNPLGLGATAIFPARLVYNTKRSGKFELAGRRFLLRRVKFPDQPTAEWAAVDLIENRAMAGVPLEILEAHLAQAIAARRLRMDKLRRAANVFGIQSTRDLIERAGRS